MNNTSLPTSAPLDYLETYSLGCAPFENRNDTKFFYAGSALMQRLDLLTHLTQFGEPLVVITGPRGSGKTTLLQQFATQSSNRWRLCMLGKDDVDRLPHCMAEALGVDASAGIDDLLNRWDTETDASQLLVIVIDDAETLDEDSCRLLCGLLDKPQAERVRILLFGTPELQARIKQVLATQSSIRTPQLLEVPRLSEEETAAYLMYRLAVAGYSGESPFSTTEVRAICKAADGWPGAINDFADQTLQDHAARIRSQHDQPQRRRNKTRFLLALVLALTVSISYLVWRNLWSPAQETSESPAPGLAKSETSLALPEPEPREFRRKADSGLPLPTPAAEAAKDLSQQDLASGPPMPETGKSPAPSAAPAPAPAPAAAEQPAGIPDATGTVATDPAAGQEPVTAPVIKPPPLEESESPSVPQTSRPEPAALPHREAWLLAQPGQDFSLQLLGSRSEHSVTSFIKQHQLDLEKTAYYQGMFKGSEWFVLLYGQYPSREAALQAIDSLPKAVRSAKPWPRQMNTVHQSLREAGH